MTRAGVHRPRGMVNALYTNAFLLGTEQELAQRLLDPAVARSVKEALTAYDDQPPDVLVSDVGMPIEDGYVLIRAIRERENGTSRRTVAIAMTGFASRLDHETALRAGFDEHLAKPVEPSALLECVRVLAPAASDLR